MVEATFGGEVAIEDPSGNLHPHNRLQRAKEQHREVGEAELLLPTRNQQLQLLPRSCLTLAGTDGHVPGSVRRPRGLPLHPEAESGLRNSPSDMATAHAHFPLPRGLWAAQNLAALCSHCTCSRPSTARRSDALGPRGSQHLSVSSENQDCTRLPQGTGKKKGREVEQLPRSLGTQHPAARARHSPAGRTSLRPCHYRLPGARQTCSDTAPLT